MTSGEVRLGVIGAGWFASRRHMPDAMAHPRTTLAAFCRRDAGARETLCKRFEVSPEHAYAAYEEMLERESLHVLDKVFGEPGLPEKWRRLEGKSRAWNDLVLSGSHFEVNQFQSAVRYALRALRRDPSLIARILALPVRRARKLLGAAQ